MFALLQKLLRSLTQDQVNEIQLSPILWHKLDVVQSNLSQETFMSFMWEALYWGSPLRSSSVLQDPSFIYQVEQELGEELITKWNNCNRGTIWDFAGIRQHILINGTLRPVITWKK
jgi:hypothetical protein